MKLKFNEKQWPWSLLTAFFGGVLTDIFLVFTGKGVSGWASGFSKEDGFVLPLFSAAILLSPFIVSSWTIFKKREWFIWPMLASSFAGMTVSQVLIADFKATQLAYFGLIVLMCLIFVVGFSHESFEAKTEPQST